MWGEINMKKKILLMVALAALIAIPVFAATESVNPMNEHHSQMMTHHQQMIEQAVADGTITSEEAATLKDSMDKIAPIMQKIMQKGGMMGNGMMKNHEKMQGGQNQMMAHHQQMIEQAVTDGTITSEEAATLKESMENTAPIMQKIMQKDGMMGKGMMKNHENMKSGMMENGNNSGPCVNQ